MEDKNDADKIDYPEKDPFPQLITRDAINAISSVVVNKTYKIDETTLEKQKEIYELGETAIKIVDEYGNRAIDRFEEMPELSKTAYTEYWLSLWRINDYHKSLTATGNEPIENDSFTQARQYAEEFNSEIMEHKDEAVKLIEEDKYEDLLDLVYRLERKRYEADSDENKPNPEHMGLYEAYHEARQLVQKSRDIIKQLA